MEVVIITGLSGAGKTQAMDCMEDMGYYCIDNMPPALIESFLSLSQENTGIDKAAFVVDVRGGQLFDDFEKSLDNLRTAGIEYKLIFLEASERTLIKRYSETRRKHPLSDGPVADAIKQEKEKLKGIRKVADYVIDTSNIKTARLWDELKHIVTGGKGERSFMINIMSFGYKKGIPLVAEMVYDMRFIPNPYYVESLRKLTGNSQKVSHYVLKQEITQKFIEDTVKSIETLIPYYMHEGKFGINICFGCTGGHHRSVAVANEVNRILQEHGHRTTLEHRELRK